MIELKNARSLALKKPDLADLVGHIDRTPAGHTVKGMYVAGILDALDARKVRRPDFRVQAFRDYPLRQYMELLLDAAVTLYPSQPIRSALVSLGKLAIPTFASSIVGGVIMGTVGRSWDIALKCVSKGYQISLRPGNAVVTNAGPGRAVLQLREVWNFADSYQVGVVEGLLEWCDLQGTVKPRVLGPCDVDLDIEWSEWGSYSRRDRETESNASRGVALD
ncbi:MAG: DUF2378 family protein [Pseudomonadota bacterium]|nr:MAG: hypothetical protein DIU78_02535 [Pseudomonadota bacterium]